MLRISVKHSKMFEFNVMTFHDIEKIDRKLRNMYNVYPGEPCQILMSTEYIRWKNEVKKRLRQPCTLPTYVDAFLPGFHIGFELHSCQINKTTLSLPSHANGEIFVARKKRKC